MKPRLPRYRVWAGLTIWGVFIGADIYLTATTHWWRNGGPAGLLVLAGFVVVFVWSWKAPE